MSLSALNYKNKSIVSLTLDFLFFVLVLSSTFDLILNFEFKGFTVRFAHFVELLFIGFVWFYIARKDTWFLKDTLIYAIAGYLFIALLSLSKSYFLLKSAGYFSWALFDFFMFIAIASYVRSHPIESRPIDLFLIASIIVALFGLMQQCVVALGGPALLVTQWVGRLPRINSFFYEPSFFAFFSVIGLSITGTILVLRKDFLWFYFVVWLILETALFMSTSRSGWIAMGATIFILFFLARRSGTLKRFFVAVFSLIIVASLIMAIISFMIEGSVTSSFVQMAKKGLDIHDKASAQPRIESTFQGLRIFRDNAFLGVGVGGYGGYVVTHPEVITTENVVRKGNAYTIVTHNLWVEVLAETGILGFSALLMVLFVFVRRALKSIKSYGDEYVTSCLVAVLIMFFVSYQFNHTLFRQDVWILFGLGLGLINRYKSSEHMPTVRVFWNSHRTK